MPTQIAVTQATLEPAKTVDGWHLHKLEIVFNTTNITGMDAHRVNGGMPSISAEFVPYYLDGDTKVAVYEKRKTVAVTNPVRVGQIYDLYVKNNEQLGPVIENMVWREAQDDLSIPQAQIDALPTVTNAAPF